MIDTVLDPCGVPPVTEVHDMEIFDRTEVVIRNGRMTFRITDEFDKVEREKIFSCSSNFDEIGKLQTIMDCRGRVYLVTDVSMLVRNRIRQIAVTLIDPDGEEF